MNKKRYTNKNDTIVEPFLQPVCDCFIHLFALDSSSFIDVTISKKKIIASCQYIRSRAPMKNHAHITFIQILIDNNKSMRCFGRTIRGMQNILSFGISINFRLILLHLLFSLQSFSLGEFLKKFNMNVDAKMIVILDYFIRITKRNSDLALASSPWYVEKSSTGTRTILMKAFSEET